jgi:uncharacterized repeat protein (TIGR04076 family)
MIDERMWKIVQKKLRYNDEEMAAFKADPRNEHVIQKGEDLLNTRFIAEIVQAQGCNSRHKVGDKIYFDGYGNLIREQSPERLCIFALSSLSTLMFAAHELIYAGIDPNQMQFKSVGCIDVGLKCGGWGKITMRLTAEKVEKRSL